MKKYVVIGIIYIALVALLIESAVAISKKVTTLRCMKKQIKRLGITSKLTELKTDKPEESLKRAMLNYQKAVVLTCMAISCGVCTGLLAKNWNILEPLHIIVVATLTVAVTTMVGVKIEGSKTWALEGCSKLIAVSALYKLVGCKNIQDKLVKIRGHVDKCPTARDYKNGIKEKIESIMVGCEKEYGNGKIST